MTVKPNDHLPVFAAPVVQLDVTPSHDLLLRSTQPLAPHAVSVLHSLQEWVDRVPGRPLVCERTPSGEWSTHSYRQVWDAARSVATGLSACGVGRGAPLLILSENSVNHLIVSLGAMMTGGAVVPVSTAYSQLSGSLDRIRLITEMTRPAAIFVEDAGAYARAIAALAPIPAIVGRHTPGTDLSIEAMRQLPHAAVDLDFDPSTVAKILFTSGSTGMPKGVPNTHGMLAANQQMLRQAWPFLNDEPPVIVDWLPWSHTFGGNQNLNMILSNGGTLYIDDGRPTDALFGRSLQNLVDVAPTIYFNVPTGYHRMVDELENDGDLAEQVFRRMRLLFSAAAALPTSTRERLRTLVRNHSTRPIPITAGWGTTETAPAVTNAHFEFEDSRCIGVPLPGAEVKLTPLGGDYEISVRGPMVTPGYLDRPDITAESFDDDGFYHPGDRVNFVSPDDPAAGLIFLGRLTEDFKLATGTFVRVGALRVSLLSALPCLGDAVIVGENREFVTALAWLSGSSPRREATDAAPDAEPILLADDSTRDAIERGLAEHNRSAGSSGRVTRLLLMGTPPSSELGEITDKGYVNQRRVRELRSKLIELLYESEPQECVLQPNATAQPMAEATISDHS